MIHRANYSDIPSLTKIRLEFLQEEFGKINDDAMSQLKESLPTYFEKNLNKNIFCYLEKENEEIVSCAFLLVVEKPANPMFLSGKTGTVFNVYTKPSHRMKGYAKDLMTALLSDASKMNLSTVDLLSTKSGYHLYKSLGFADIVSEYRPMEWKNI